MTEILKTDIALLEEIDDVSIADKSTLEAFFRLYSVKLEGWMNAALTNKDHIEHIFSNLHHLHSHITNFYIASSKASKFSALKTIRNFYDIKNDLEKLGNNLKISFEKIEEITTTLPESEKSIERITEISTQMEKEKVDLEKKEIEVNAKIENVKGIIDVIESAARRFSDLMTQSEELLEKSKQQQETNLTIEGEVTELKTRIEGLLPGATSVGLAKSFHEKEVQLSRSKRLWMLLFALSILALVTVQSEILKKYGIEISGGGFIEFLGFKLKAAKIFVSIPLVWLAWFCAKQFGYAVRLEEQYKFKASVSTAFEGYKTQMKDIDVETAKFLSVEAIRVITENPGNIFNKKGNEAHPIENVSASWLKKFLRLD